MFSLLRQDPDNLGLFVRWRVSFYIAGDDDCVSNFLYLFDDTRINRATDACIFVIVLVSCHLMRPGLLGFQMQSNG